MPNYCLVPHLAEQFKKDLIDGKIDPIKLSSMTSAERNTFFGEKLGNENATNVNALFESKLLLKNQKAGMVRWAKAVTGMSKQVQRDLISRIERMDKVLNPKEQEAFLEDLASRKLGTHISYEEAQKISELSKKIQETKGVGDRMDYGRNVVQLQNYINGLKEQAGKFSLLDFKKNPIKSLGKGITEIAGNAKAIKASLDNSAIFRQGWKTLWTNPDIWLNNAAKSFADIVKTFGKDQVMNELNADIQSRPNYDLMKKAKLDVGITEESFPTALPEKIPVFGKFYKASENAFTGFIHKTRADVFDKMIEIAKKSNVELDDKELKSIGKMVNSLTGRGHLGVVEPAANVVNNILFSPRLIKSHIDLLTQPISGAGGSNFVRKQSALNLIKVIAGTAAVLTIARIIKKDSVELDPRSSDFGKIKVGNTRFDVTGGMGSLVTLAVRLARNSTKSTTTGKITPLNQKDKSGKPKFGAPTKFDVLIDYFSNKLSPASSVIKDLLKDETFQGTKPTLLNETGNLAVPLPITTGWELYKTPGAANLLLGLIADGLGVATNTYAPSVPKLKAKKIPKFHF